MAHTKFSGKSKRPRGGGRGANRSGGRKPRNQQLVVLERAAGLTIPRQRLTVGVNLANTWLPVPRGPRQGSVYTTRQLASTFNTETGLSLVGGGTVAAVLILNSAVAVMFSVAFSLNDLTQAATFAALFDAYRFERVKLHFKSRNNALSVQNVASPNASVPSGVVVVDRDDATALASIAAASEYDNVVEFSGNESFTVDLVPSVTRALYASAAFSGYEPVDSDSIWIDMANTAVPCYGVKGGVSSLTATTTSSWVWDITAEYVVSFKHTR